MSKFTITTTDTDALDEMRAERVDVTKGVSAQNISKYGDRIGGRKVGDVAIGDKWVTVTYEDDGLSPKTNRFARQDAVDVTRSESTRRADEAQRISDLLRQVERQASSDVETDFAEQVEKHGLSHTLRWCGESTLGDLNERALWLDLQAALAAKADDEPVLDVAAAYLGYHAHLALTVSEGGTSSSAMSNLNDKAEHAARTSFIKALARFVGSKLTVPGTDVEVSIY
jgi:hypothetical protein